MYIYICICIYFTFAHTHTRQRGKCSGRSPDDGRPALHATHPHALPAASAREGGTPFDCRR